MKTDVARPPLWQQLKALSDPTRLDILAHIGADECCVCELTEALDVPQPLLSFHLRVLKEAGIVSDRREGRWSYYVVNTEALVSLGKSIGTATERARQKPRKRRVCTEG